MAYRPQGIGRQQCPQLERVAQTGYKPVVLDSSVCREDRSDLVNELDELLTIGDIHGLLGVARCLYGPPEEIVELRERLDVMGFEEI